MTSISNIQGQNGTPYIEYFDGPHSLAFRWDGSQDDDDARWIDVSFGGTAEPVRLRIPWVIHLTGPVPGNVSTDLLTAFATTCEHFVDLLHDMEAVDKQAHAS